MTSVSVIVCTHNPRRDHFERVVAALHAQTLSVSEWELLIVDNASAEPVATRWPFPRQRNVRHVREEKLGLTAARLRGISEARGDLLVFVDDDNVLAPFYLERSMAIAAEWPLLGAWGGTIRGEFEVRPQNWMVPLLEYLAIRTFKTIVWSNNPDDWHSQPCGAGMCVRAEVARTYASKVAGDPLRRSLGRIGQSLSSCEDNDLVLTSCDLGLGFGNFPQLSLTHLIPASRVSPDYFVRLVQGVTASNVLLRYIRYGKLRAEPNPVMVWLRYLSIRVREDRHKAMMYKASQDAIRSGIRSARALSTEAAGRLPI